MTNWPDPERELIARYVAGINLRTTNSPIYYRQALDIFQDVAEHHAKLDKDMLVAWLHVSPGRWASTTRLHRTRIIDRFLDHLEKIGAIEHNPVAVLREVCNIKQCMPVWRALASRDPDSALVELCQPRLFGSVLGNMMVEHVRMMRNRGYRYTSQAMRLWRLDRFLQLNPELQDQPLEVMLEHWSAAKRNRLDLGDVDFQGGTITIRQTKFYKTRILPLPDSVMVELRSYTEARRRASGFLDLRSGLFWQERRGDRYTKQAVAWLLVDVIRRAEAASGANWTSPARSAAFDGREPDPRMVRGRHQAAGSSAVPCELSRPWDINSTLVYITVTQDLLHHANERFRVLGAPRLNIGQEVRA
ncbi:integrase [Brucella sp. TWI432]